ncbi:MAG: PAS domain S-box protein [Steroidobacteraceae bacterium]|nr:PAS domain S-box protein [Deltaproteobacteria bacterium]
MSIKVRMFLLALVITGCVSAMAVTAIISMSNLSENFHSLRSHEITTKISITRLSRELIYLSRLTRDIMLGGDYVRNMQAIDDIIEKSMEDFEKLKKAAVTEQDRKLIAETYSDTRKWLDSAKTMMTALGKLPVEDRYKAYKEYDRVITPPSLKTRDRLRELSKTTSKDFENGVESFENTISKSATWIIVISLVAIIAIITSFIVILRTILTEIENRNRAEEALSASEKKARALLDGIDNCAYLIDPAGIILDINAKAAKCAGKEAVELAGTCLWDHYSQPGISQSRQRRAAEVMVSGEPARFEDELGGRAFDQTYYPILNATGEVAKIAVLAIDVTEQKKALQALKESEKRFRTLIEHAPIGIAMFRDHHYTYVNRAYMTIFEFNDPSDLIGTLVEERIAPQCRSEITAMELRCVKGESVPSGFETVCMRKDGSQFPCYVDITKLIFDDGPMSISFARDLTEREQARELMIQTEKMTMIGGLAAGMAHEINNPIGIIVQNLHNIERRLALDSPDNQEVAEELGISLTQIRTYLEKRSVLKLLATMYKAGERTARIVSNMLQFSRKSGSERRLAVLPDIIEHAVDLAANYYDLKHKYDFCRINIVRHFEVDLPQIPVNATEFEQVMINILKNAAQAMAECGTPKPEINLSTYREGAMAVVKVSDNGPGMDENTRKRIFEPFFTTKEVGAGTGLGLSVSYALISQNHKGIFTVDSTPGNGTCFTIKLPLV